METRFVIINNVLEIEYRLSNILLLILRILKDNTYTLSHKTSSLSAKNKIDLLFDLSELDKIEYEQFKTIIEIRNQFAHNLRCEAFLNLKEMNSDLTNKLLKYFKNDILDEEEKYLNLFLQLFNACKKKLEKLLESYLAGLFLEPKKYIAYNIVEDIDIIIEDAQKLWYEKSGDSIENNYSVQGFILSLRSAIATKNVQLQKIVSNNRGIVFDKKSDINKLKEEFKILDEFISTQNLHGENSQEDINNIPLA